MQGYILLASFQIFKVSALEDGKHPDYEEVRKEGERNDKNLYNDIVLVTEEHLVLSLCSHN